MKDKIRRSLPLPHEKTNALLKYLWSLSNLIMYFNNFSFHHIHDIHANGRKTEEVEIKLNRARKLIELVIGIKLFIPSKL